MCRKKPEFFHSILFGISVWILGLGLAGLLLIGSFVKLQTRYQLEKQITDDMLRVRDNSLLYVRQTLLLNDSRTDAAGFKRYGEEIRETLENAGYREIFLCDEEGELLSGDLEAVLLRREQEDFQLAGKQESAFVIRYGEQERCDVFFSIPVVFHGQLAGTISFLFDYGELYRGQRNLITRMLWIVVGVFSLIFLVIWLMVSRILSPVRKLSEAAGRVSANLADGRQGSAVLSSLGLQKRRDEIGGLANNYLEMLRVIEEQVERIREDKDRILKLWSSRQEFYNQVTHELKTPLTTISGYAQLMEKNGPRDEELFYSGTGHILRESTRLHRMVVQLLELQDKAEAGSAERLELGEILQSVAESMEIKARRYGNTLLAEKEEETGYYMIGREDKIRQVLINVIDNAIKYGERDQPIRIRMARAKGRCLISVANRGPGIREEEREMIFEPFYRADKTLSREMGSSGLGLSIVARILKEHGGEITLVSDPEEETVFTMAFPEAADERDAKRPQNPETDRLFTSAPAAEEKEK